MTLEAPARRSILVVEDDALLRYTLALSLGELGYEVVGAAHGQEALDHLTKGERPALIVLDLSMPVMDGWQFRRRQFENEEWAPIPVLILTAADTAAQHAAALGATAYLEKPVALDQLVAMIHALTDAGPESPPSPSP